MENILFLVYYPTRNQTGEYKNENITTSGFSFHAGMPGIC